MVRRSVADKVAQVAGANAAGGRARLMPIAGSMIRRVLDVVVARTGLTERQARAVVGANFQMTTVHVPSHDAYFPGSELVLVQLFWDRSTGRVLGAEVAVHGAEGERGVLAPEVVGGCVAHFDRAGADGVGAIGHAGLEVGLLDRRAYEGIGLEQLV